VIVIGVDGGATKTDAVVVDDAGRVLGMGAATGSNWELVGLDGALAAVRDAVEGALRDAGTELAAVDASTFALAGCDWPSDHERLSGALAPLGTLGAVTIVNDTVAALRAGTHDAFGIASVAGTGGSTTGRNRDGATARTLAITWGEGSGASGMVRDALHAMARAYHAQTPPTTLTAAWCRELGYADAPALFEALSRHDYRAASPALCPLVTACAREGDEAAMRVVREAGAQHGADVVGVARRLEMLDDTFDVVGAGGVHRADEPLFRDAFRATIAAVVPGARFVTLTTRPVVGAALLALESLGVDAAPLRAALSEAANGTAQERGTSD
jgi:N-acetylglucosamine kinase-like BadF-type ATPase